MILFAGIVFYNIHSTFAYQIGSGNLGVDINPNVPFQAGEEGVNKIVNTVFSTAIIVSGIIFVVLILIGGLQYLTASGNEEQVKKARALFLQAIIGLVITLASWAIGTWIIGALQR